MKPSLYIMGAVVALAASAKAQNTPNDSYQAQAGLRLGRIFIGDTRAAVARRLGKPTSAFNLGRGLTSQVWRSRKLDADTGKHNTVEVVYRNGIVSQIEATSLVFKTPSKLSLTSSRVQWERVYGKPLVSTYDYNVNGRKRYLDWKAKGMAVELVEDEDETRANDGWIYQTLIVHKRGVPVLVDVGGIRE